MIQTETRYAAVGDDRVAYQVLGQGPLTLLLSFSWWGMLDSLFDEPTATRFFRKLSKFCRLVLVHSRGSYSGLSDPRPDDGRDPWAHWAEDLLAVIEALRANPIALLSNLGTEWALRFAAEHPQLCSHLILINATARIAEAPGYSPGLSADELEKYVQFSSKYLGTERWTLAINPSLASNEPARQRFSRFSLRVGSPKEALKLQRFAVSQDVREYLPRITAATLVMSRATCRLVPPTHGRYLAEQISGARFVDLPGSDLWMCWEEPDLILGHIEGFLTGRHIGERPLRAVLFTDVVGSTERAAKLGDAGWRRLLDRHDDIVRAQVALFDGKLIERTGDGTLATFQNPDQALDCAMSLHNAVGELDIALRAGVHFGQVELREDGRVGGIAVHLGARVMSLAHAGEVLVSQTVQQVLLGSHHCFEERGIHELKGVPGTWPLYAMKPSTDANAR